MYVAVMNQVGAECGLTLLVGGVWISGSLISARQWMEATAALLRQAGDAGAGVAEFFAYFGRTYFPSESEIEVGEIGGVEVSPAPRDALPMHVHLRDTRSCSGTTPLPEQGALLRVRLDQVEGWFIGQLGPAGYVPPPPPLTNRD